MDEEVVKQGVIADFLVLDTQVRAVLGGLPNWLKQQEAMVGFREAFPGAFKGTALEKWEPMAISAVLELLEGSQSNPAVNPEPPDLQPPKADGPVWTPYRGVRDINRHTAKLAEAALKQMGLPMTARDLETMLRADGWPGFSYLKNPPPEEVRWTLYRVLQSRPNTFALRGKNGRWGLVEWPKEDGM